MTSSAPLLEMRDVRRVYGRPDTPVIAIDGVSLRVERGEFVAIMGTSGSGKSTLLTLAGGLDRATSGQVCVNGTDIAALSPKKLAALRRRSLGFVFQDYNLVPTLTALENVSLPLELDGVSLRRARRAAIASLTGLGLADLGARYPDDLSGGQQQRVAIARAFVGDRSLILADEPTGALDSVTGETVLALMRRQVDDGKGALLVTHDARHAAWADRIVYLRDGRSVDTTVPRAAADVLAPSEA